MKAFDASGFYENTKRKQLGDVIAATGDSNNASAAADADANSSSNSSSVSEVAVLGEQRVAVDPRSGKYGQTHIVKEQGVGSFDVLLGKQWRDGATRVLGMQLLEADDIRKDRQYEVQLRDKVYVLAGMEPWLQSQTQTQTTPRQDRTVAG